MTILRKPKVWTLACACIRVYRASTKWHIHRCAIKKQLNKDNIYWDDVIE